MKSMPKRKEPVFSGHHPGKQRGKLYLFSEWDWLVSETYSQNNLRSKLTIQRGELDVFKDESLNEVISAFDKIYKYLCLKGCFTVA